MEICSAIRGTVGRTAAASPAFVVSGVNRSCTSRASPSAPCPFRASSRARILPCVQSKSPPRENNLRPPRAGTNRHFTNARFAASTAASTSPSPISEDADTVACRQDCDSQTSASGSFDPLAIDKILEDLVAPYPNSRDASVSVAMISPYECLNIDATEAGKVRQGAPGKCARSSGGTPTYRRSM